MLLLAISYLPFKLTKTAMAQSSARAESMHRVRMEIERLARELRSATNIRVDNYTPNPLPSPWPVPTPASKPPTINNQQPPGWFNDITYTLGAKTVEYSLKSFQYNAQSPTGLALIRQETPSNGRAYEIVIPTGEVAFWLGPQLADPMLPSGYKVNTGYSTSPFACGLLQIYAKVKAKPDEAGLNGWREDTTFTHETGKLPESYIEYGTQVLLRNP